MEPGKILISAGSGPGSWTTLPYIVANERGFFEKEGLKVRLITFRGTSLMLTALHNAELILPDAVVDDLLAVGTFRLKEKLKGALNPQAVRDCNFAEKAKR